MMTKEEIIEMAKKCGWDNPAINMSPLYEFAKLVRADYGKLHASLWLKRIDDAVKKEREECAKICEKLVLEDDSFYGEFSGGKDCVKAIRARGQE
jgi:hypothetical protein